MIDQTKEAIQTIVHHRTLPPQIDYINPIDRHKVNVAEDYLCALPEAERIEAYTQVTAEVDAYWASDEKLTSVIPIAGQNISL